ncbi:CHAT domain-containing protein [Pedobacter sp. Leaf250]|uniref:CHAT domain-containing protein n=1 Tax=Pedobacter sp. Leaf250 TaxID=2876559 RepID=UPI001E2F8338|nr:CHAT domain-containing protein [Pedobacter sp. Leaf250]
MPLIDSYRRNVNKFREDIASLIKKKALEGKNLSSISSRIQASRKTLLSTKNLSTIKSKNSEISRYSDQYAKSEKKIADIDAKISKIELNLARELAKLSKEEISEQNKRSKQNAQIQQAHQLNLNTLQNTVNVHGLKLRELSNLPKKITVLFFASNPVDQGQLFLDEEIREIQKNILSSKHRDSVKLESCWAVRPVDILQGLNEFQPVIVHFSGHGTQEDELVLMDNQHQSKTVSIDAIVQTMHASTDSIRLVFFNTCHSHRQAEKVVDQIEVAIGMTTSISDNAARIFAAQFYGSIGYGNSVKKSFEQARASLMLEGIPEENTPKLYIKNGLNAENIFIVKP